MLELPEKVDRLVEEASEEELTALRRKLINRVSWGVAVPFSGEKSAEVSEAYNILVEMGYNRGWILRRAVEEGAPVEKLLQELGITVGKEVKEELEETEEEVEKTPEEPEEVVSKKPKSEEIEKVEV